MKRSLCCFFISFCLLVHSATVTCAIEPAHHVLGDGIRYESGYIIEEPDTDEQSRIIPGSFRYMGFEYTLVVNAGIQTTSGNGVTVYTTADDHAPNEVTALDSETLENYDVTLVAPSSAKYNCHSYAWYMQSSENAYYIGDISPYLRDPHCTESNNATIGAIAVYYNSDNEPIHSAVVTEIDGDSVVCHSKWGIYGVYEHTLETVPADYKANGQVSVRFYIYSRAHNLAYSCNGGTSHTASCTICDYQSTGAHSCRVTYTNTTHTRTCRQCGWQDTTSHTWNPVTNKCTICGYQSTSGPVQPLKTSQVPDDINYKEEDDGYIYE